VGSRSPVPGATPAPAPAPPLAIAAEPAASLPGEEPAGRPRQRRSFSQRNLAQHGEGPLGALLGQALAVPAEEGYAGTHAFHPYPGRFHPALPRTLLAAVARPGQHVLDPFMGGGTTLVEALQQGLRASGSDLNPVALRVARERTRPRTHAEARAVEAEARRIAAAVEALRREKNPPRLHHPRARALLPHYQPHLLAELMQWLRLIAAVPAGPARETLHAVFSSGAVKFSNLSSDSRAEAGTPPRYGKGAVTRFLLAKCVELLHAQVALAGRIPPGTPPPALYDEDARLLPSLGWGACDLVLTSPPYPGTYDYHAQHRLRLDWLELDDAAFAAGEIGARRHAQAGAEGEAGWSESLRDVLGTLGRVLRPGGALFLVMGDWIASEHAVDAKAQLARLAQARGWHLESHAAVQRDAHSRPEARAFAKRGKWEHLLHFTRPGAAEAGPATPRRRERQPRRKGGGRIRTL
jgi:DNA modification methylase